MSPMEKIDRPATFYDTHAHLDYPEFAQELPEVIARAGLAGITKIISIGTDLESSKRAIKLAEQFSNVFAVVGWHPSNAMEAPAKGRGSGGNRFGLSSASVGQPRL